MIPYFTHVLFYPLKGRRIRHHITAWLRAHGYDYHVGSGMVFVFVPSEFKHPKRNKALLLYAKGQNKPCECNVYLCSQTHDKEIDAILAHYKEMKKW